MTPTITVYIANHNYGRYLDEAVRSVLDQTCRDFELIIIDDGSTDDSLSVIEKYEGDPHVRIIHQERHGLNVTNNVALRAARGIYIMRLDADDYLDKNALAILSGVLDRKPAVGMVFPDYYHVDEEGRVLEQVRRHDFGKEVSLYDSPAHGACTMIRCDCLRELGGYNEAFSCQDGYDLWLRIIGRYAVENVNLPLFYYRRHPASLTHDESRIVEARGQILGLHASNRGTRDLETVALIPIRGKRVDAGSPAFEMLGGRLFMDWTLDAVLDVPDVKWAAVSSSDDQVLHHVRERYGNRVATFARPVRMERSNLSPAETFRAMIAEYLKNHEEPGAVLQLFIDYPFRSARFLQQAANIMKIFDVDCVVGVRPETEQFYRHDGGGLVPVKSSEYLRLEREDMYRLAGGMVLLRYPYFKMTPRIGGRLGHVILDQKAAMRVTTPLDLKVMRRIAEEGW